MSPPGRVAGLLLVSCAGLANGLSHQLGTEANTATLEVRRAGKPGNNISLLRRSVSSHSAVVGSHAGECLRFMHIPKTGGTSIDSHNLNMPFADRAFDSQMNPVYDQIAKVDSQKRDAGKLFDWSHKDMETYGPFLIMNAWAYQWHMMPDKEICHSVHAPPLSDGSDDRLLKFYQKKGCSTFCVVREPLQRFLSTASFDRFFDCNTTRPQAVKNFENMVVKALGPFGWMKSIPYIAACHFVPQVQMVYGRKYFNKATDTYCDRILYQEDLTNEFNQLMLNFGSGLQLSGKPKFDSKFCMLKAEDVSKQTKKLVYEYYKEDYKAFGYPRPY